MDEIERLYEEAVTIKNQIVRANLRLVVSIAKRHVGATDDFFELVSDGNMSLMRAVEKFDYARGNKFSTYATWAIMKNYARTIPDEHGSGIAFGPATRKCSRGRRIGGRTSTGWSRLKRSASCRSRRFSSDLDEREQKIIISRFGLTRGHEPQTLKEVGAELGVTKERIRQIEARALTKLRNAALREKIDTLES